MKNNNLKIQVLGSGCPSCKKLYNLVNQAVADLGLDIKAEYITDIQRIVQMGVMQSPVLAINNKPILTGFINDIEKIKKIIQENI